MDKKLSVIGIGKLGLTFALLCEKAGYEVLGCDVRKEYIEQLNRKEINTSEPQVEELLKGSKKFIPTESINWAIGYSDLLFCFVATPSLESGEYDHQYIEEIVNSLFQYEQAHKGGLNGKTLIVCCTTMPTYCKRVQERLQSIGMDVVYNPEFIAQGDIVNGLEKADFVLIGCDERYDLIDLYEVYGMIMKIKPTFKVHSLTAAEIIKIGLNCFLTTKLSYANMISEIGVKSGESTEAVKEMIATIGSDKRIGGDYLSYGFGYGGPCFPRDTNALGIYASKIGVPILVPRAADEMNKAHLFFLKEKFISDNPNKDIPFIFNQLTYKKGVDIITESQHYKLCEELLNEGYKVIVVESQAVVDLVLPKLSKYNGQVKYFTRDSYSRHDERFKEQQRQQGHVIEL